MFGQTDIIEENTLISKTSSLVQASVDTPFRSLERISSSPHFNVFVRERHQLLAVVFARHIDVKSARDCATVFYLDVNPSTHKIC